MQNSEDFDYESQGLLHEMFMQQAQKVPNTVAVVSPGENKQMTYRELDEASDIVAAGLQRRGLQEGDIVALYMDKNLDMCILYFAALKAGGALLIIDKFYKVSFVAGILRSAQPVLVFVQPSLEHILPDYDSTVVTGEGWINKFCNSEAGLLHTPNLTLDSPAMIRFTSGTTGEPKGIRNVHRGLVLATHYRRVVYPTTLFDTRAACFAFFDEEMILPLTQGITMYIIPEEEVYDPVLLCKFMKKYAITRVTFSPSQMEALLNVESLNVQDHLLTLRHVLLAGEVLPISLFIKFNDTLPWVQCVNFYGSNENHIVCTTDLSLLYHMDRDAFMERKTCPVGIPPPGVYVAILSEELKPQPFGVAGEVYVGGPGLALSYFKPEHNFQHFIERPNTLPPNVPERLYKSGDWGHMSSDGNLEIQGRCDSRVKIRGFSIEIQAIEKTLAELPQVKSCAVLAQGEEGINKKLVAYVVPNNGTKQEDPVYMEKRIRANLKQKFPHYMVPAVFVFLKSLPLIQQSGKLDKRALTSLEFLQTKDTNSQDQNAESHTEKTLFLLWSEVLSHKHIDMHESFFDIGGNSLLVVKLMNKVNDLFGIELTASDFFTHSSLSAMAHLIDMQLEQGTENGTSTCSLDLMSEVHEFQLTKNIEQKVHGFWQATKYAKRWRQARVLLTGATGFLGAFLLRDLLNNTSCHVFCLTRDLKDETASERILAAMVKYGIMSTKTPDIEQCNLTREFNNRVTSLSGDISLHQLGLSAEEYKFLCSDVDIVIHAAANVNFIYPYQMLRGPNVLGTRNLIEFACTSKVKPLHYISSMGVFPEEETECREDANITQYVGKLENGYAQSKWVAEQLVLKAMDRGLPATVYRLGLLSAESDHGCWNPLDLTWLLFQGCIATGSAPDIEYTMEMTPVNFVSKVIVTLTQKVSLSLGKVFHMINNNTIAYRIQDLEDSKGKWLAYLKSLLSNDCSDSPYGLSSTRSTFKQENTNNVLNHIGMTYPEITDDLLSTYFKALTLNNGIISIYHPSKR